MREIERHWILCGKSEKTKYARNKKKVRSRISGDLNYCLSRVPVEIICSALILRTKAYACHCTMSDVSTCGVTDLWM